MGEFEINIETSVSSRCAM